MNIVDVMQKIVEEVSAEMTPQLKQLDEFIENVRFDYGHPSELVGRLADMTQGEKAKFRKYPLIGLFLDMPEKRGTELNVESEGKLNMFIAHGSRKEWTSPERNERNFIPHLDPVYECLMRKISKSKYVIKPEGNLFEHIYIRRYFWGSQGFEFYKDGVKNVFGDYIDAIEIQGLELSIAKEYCKK
jgi:hypothetical protein